MHRQISGSFALKLFEANNHSKYKIFYRKPAYNIRRNVAEIVFRNYEVASVETSSIMQVRERENASNNFLYKPDESRV